MSPEDGPDEASSIDRFLAGVASRDQTKGRLSVGALTAAACASQLEAQCREVLQFREHAPGPDDIQSLIGDLQAARERLTALMRRVYVMETESARTLHQPGTCLEARLRKQATYDKQLAELIGGGLEVAEVIERVARLATRVRRLRSEVRGGSSTEDALLAAASVAVLDVVGRAVRWSRVRDPQLRARASRAEARLRMVSLLRIMEDGTDDAEHQLGVPRVCWN